MKLNAKNLTFFTAMLLFICCKAFSQNSYWTSVKNYPGYNTPSLMQYQNGKGLWIYGPRGIDFIDIKTKVVTNYSTDASGNKFPYIKALSVFNDEVYFCTGESVYMLDKKKDEFAAITIPKGTIKNEWQNLFLTEKGVIVAGNRSCLFIDGAKSTLINYPRISFNFTKTKLPFCGFIFGNTIVYSVNFTKGIFLMNKADRTDQVIFPNENIEVGLYEPGKGAWLKTATNIIFVSINGEQKITEPLKNFPEPIERMLQDASGKVFLFGKRAVYEMSVLGDLKQGKIAYTFNKNWRPLPYNIDKNAFVLGANADLFIADYFGIFQKSADRSTTLVENKQPVSFVDQWNYAMPDGNFYSLDGNDLYIYDGKGKYEKSKTLGAGTVLSTDGKEIYMASSNLLQKKNKQGKFEDLAELPVNLGTKIAAAQNGNIHFCANNGIGQLKNGTISFTNKNSIVNFPSITIFSIAVNNKKEVLIFSDSMYKYSDGNLTPVAGTKCNVNRHYFDNDGGQYSTDGSYNGYYLKNDKATFFKDIIKEKYGFDASVYITTSATTMDYKGRVWMLGSYKYKTYLHLLDKGKIIERFDEEAMPILKSISLNMLGYGKKLNLFSSLFGMVEYDLR